MFFWRLQLILSQTNKGTSFNQPSPSIFICYAFTDCQQKKLKRFVSPGSRFILSWNHEIVVVLSVLLIFSFLAFIKETEKLIISVFMFWVALIFKRSRSSLFNETSIKFMKTHFNSPFLAASKVRLIQKA